MFLLLDTCGTTGLVALGDAVGVSVQERLPARGAAETLLPAVARVLAAGGVGLTQLAGVGVVHGPGSFTGVRVGLAAAKGLCEAGSLPMVAVSRLAVLAAGDGPVLALLDAGRGEFYAGLYRGGEEVLERLLRRVEVLAAAAELGAGGMVVSPDAGVRESLAGELAVEPVEAPDAAALLALVLARAGRGHWSDVALIDANYLRRPDAELALERVGRR